MANSNVTPGDPNNWPRTIARSAADLDQAIDGLYGTMDENNAKFAMREFIRERIKMVLSTIAMP